MIVIFKYFTEVLLCILVANRFQLLNCKCTQSGVVREFQGKCYRFVDNAVLQISADCNLQGGIFAEIRNIDIHDFLIDTVSDIGFQWSRAYFAAHKQIGAGPWMWTYGDHIEFNKWAPGETDCFFCFDNCGLIDFDARTWVVVNCLEFHVYICQYDAVTEKIDANLLSGVTLLPNTTKVTLLPDTRNEMEITGQTEHGFSSEPSAESLLLVKTETTAGIITTAVISIVGCVLGMFATVKLAMLAFKYANTFGSPTNETTNHRNEIDRMVDVRCDFNISEFQDTNTVRFYRSNVPPNCHINVFVLPKKEELNIVS